MNKKPIIFMLLLVAISIVVGSTIAYFTSSDTFENEFDTSSYTTQVLETFQSPDDWTPGTTTPKTVVATNKGDTPVAVRMCFDEKWEDPEGNSLPLGVPNGKESGVWDPVAIVNYSDDIVESIEGASYGKWLFDFDEYVNNQGRVCLYYYKKINKNESTTSPIESVKFSDTANILSGRNCVTENESTTCTTEYDNYYKYTLNVTVDMVQYDQYKNIWNKNVFIGEGDYYVIYIFAFNSPENKLYLKESELSNYYFDDMFYHCNVVYINSMSEDNKYYSCSGSFHYIDSTYNANDTVSLKELTFRDIEFISEPVQVEEGIYYSSNATVLENASKIDYWDYEIVDQTDRSVMNFETVVDKPNQTTRLTVPAPQNFTMPNHIVTFQNGNK